MTPYYEHAGIVIYHGDCREILPTLPKVDCVVTDPPYNGVLAEKWDNQWSDDGDFLGWLGGVAADVAEETFPYYLLPNLGTLPVLNGG